MDELVKVYLKKENSKDWFVNHIRLTGEWDDQKYQEMIRLIKSILKKYRGNYLIPKDLIYFFSSEVDKIIGITKNDFFFKLNLTYLKTEEDRQRYKEMVKKRVSELEEMRNEFLYGEI